MSRTTLANDVVLDLGHTDLTGRLVFDRGSVSGEAQTTGVLRLVSINASTQTLGSSAFVVASGEARTAPFGHVFVEALGMYRTLPRALVAAGHAEHVADHDDMSSWGVTVTELRLTALPVFQAPPAGWSTFGTHVDAPSTLRLEFSTELDEAGDPLWERPVIAGCVAGSSVRAL